MQQTGTKSIFYGWYIVLGGAIITGAGVGLFSNCLSVFVKPVCDDLGFLRGPFSLYTTISSITSMLIMPFYGELFRRGLMKKTMLLSSICCGLVPLGYSYSTKLWHFYILAVLNGLMINGITMMAIGVLINNWFADKKGIATGIAYSGSGLSAAIMVPIAQRIIEAYGWRWGYRVLGLAGLLFLVPTILIVIKITPKEMSLLPLGVETKSDGKSSKQLYGLTLEQTIRTRTFWYITVAFFLSNMCVMGMYPHTIAYMTDIGYSTAFASSIVSGLMAAMIIGKTGLGAVFDRYGALNGSIIGSLSVLISAILLMFVRVPLISCIYAFSIGIACAFCPISAYYLSSSYFGDKEFSRIYSFTSMSGSLGGALGMPLSGVIYDTVGSYIPAWYFYMASGAVCILSLILAYISSRKIRFEK